jgi:hypothetical protein
LNCQPQARDNFRPANNYRAVQIHFSAGMHGVRILQVNGPRSFTPFQTQVLLHDATAAWQSVAETIPAVRRALQVL